MPDVHIHKSGGRSPPTRFFNPPARMAPPFRVIVIDDDPDLRKLIKATLEFTAGWEVAVAPDGPAGVDAVRESQPDAVLVDVMMPGMDGYEVCRRLKEDPATAAIPVVFLTARREVDDEQVAASGAAGVVLKPFDPDELASTVRQLCGNETDA